MSGHQPGGEEQTVRRGRPTRSVKLLGSPLELHDVRDTESLCRSVLDRVLRTWGARLKPDDYEDALTFLLEHAWKLSGRYEQHPTMKFSTYCSRILEKRIVDWYRKRFGDARYRQSRPIVLSLDVLTQNLEENDQVSFALDELADPTDDHEEVLFDACVAS